MFYLNLASYFVSCFSSFLFSLILNLYSLLLNFLSIGLLVMYSLIIFVVTLAIVRFTADLSSVFQIYYFSQH